MARKIIFSVLTVLIFSSLFALGFFLKGFNGRAEFMYYLVDYPLVSYPMPYKHNIHFENYGLSNIVVDHLTMRTEVRPKSDEHLFLVGGSNMTGWKIDRKDTIFDKLSQEKRFDKFDIISLAYPGWGLNNIYERFNIYPLSDFTPTKKGYLVYLFSDIHFERSCGGQSFLNWANTTRVYRLENGKLVRGEYYKNSTAFKLHKIKTGFRKFLNIFKTVKVKDEPSFEHTKNKDCQEIVSKLALEVKKRYLKAFPEGKFIMVNLNFVDDSHYKNIFAGIVDSYSTTSPLIKGYKHDEIFQHDAHVTPVFNDIFVKHLVKVVDQFN